MKLIHSGKVREIYEVSEEQLAIVTTDRVSAFDVILPATVKNKGVVLNTISNFFFENTKDIIPNHIISSDVNEMPEFFHEEKFKDRTVLVEKLRMLPYEIIVRGYIFGNMWKAYEEGSPFCGIQIKGDYKLAEKLEQPIVTPSTKAETGHDEYIDIKTMEQGLGTDLTNKIIEVSLKLYEECSRYAISRGIIIADTKFEFGLNKNNELVLADEIFTPDSSRFWSQADYQVGTSPKSYDKQFIRDWLLNNKVNGEMQFDSIPQEVIEDTEKIYMECQQKLLK